MGNISEKAVKVQEFSGTTLTRDLGRANRLPKECIRHLGLVHHRLVLFPVPHHHDVPLGGWEADGQSHPSSYLGAQSPAVRLQIAAHQNFHCLLRSFWGNNSCQDDSNLNTVFHELVKNIQSIPSDQ